MSKLCIVVYIDCVVIVGFYNDKCFVEIENKLIICCYFFLWFFYYVGNKVWLNILV